MQEYARAAAIVDLSAIAKNTENIKKLISKNTMLMAMVKADGYGHGATEVSRTAIENGAEWLGVASPEEGLELRDAGIKVPILVLGAVYCDGFEASIEKELTLTVFNLDIAERISAAAMKLRKTAKVHIKTDTGMSRLGFGLSEAKQILDIAAMRGIEITGIFSHLCESEIDDKAFSLNQMEMFMKIVRLLELSGLAIPVKHISNSGGILDLPDFNLDIVRAGIILYGLSPTDYEGARKLYSMGFEPALSLKTRIASVKTLPKGASVGYNRTFFTKSEILCATISYGYADGYGRALSNCGKVLINGEFAPIIGNVCMDQFMVDITHIGALAGDEVVLIGKQKNSQITAEELALLRNTNNYEVVTTIGKRVPKIYF